MKKSKKKIIIPCAIVGGLLIVILIGVAISNMVSRGAAAIHTVEIVPVEYRDLSDSISLKGTVSGESRTNVSSTAGAEVTTVNVQVGDIVDKGDVLCVLDSADINEQLTEAQKNVTNASALSANQTKQNEQNLIDAKADQKTSLTNAQNAINQAQAEYNNLSAAYNSCNTSLTAAKNQLSAAANAYNAAIAETNTANAAMQAAKTELDSAAEGDKPAKQAIYDAAVTTYNEKKAISDNAAKVQTAATETVAELQSAFSSYQQQVNTAAQAVNNAKTQYNSIATETNRSIAGYQNVIDMQQYQSSDDSSKTLLESLQEQLADCTVYAPCSGVVTAVNVSVGDNNMAGSTIVTIEDTSQMKIVVSVDEADILKLEEGMEAIVKTDATGEEEIEGTVTRVVRVKNQSTGSTLEPAASTGYSAEITIGESELLVGMSAKARIILKNKENTLCVPYDLVQTDEEGNTYVLVAKMNEDGTATAVRKNITVGEEVDYYTEVTGGELKAGDMLVYDILIMEGQSFTPSQTITEGDMEDGQ